MMAQKNSKLLPEINEAITAMKEGRNTRQDHQKWFGVSTHGRDQHRHTDAGSDRAVK